MSFYAQIQSADDLHGTLGLEKLNQGYVRHACGRAVSVKRPSEGASSTKVSCSSCQVEALLPYWEFMRRAGECAVQGGGIVFIFGGGASRTVCSSLNASSWEPIPRVDILYSKSRRNVRSIRH